MTFDEFATLLLVPPLNLALLAALALCFPRRRAARALVIAAVAGLVLLAMPAIGNALILSLERLPEPRAAMPPAAIVVLGGEIRRIPGSPGADLGPLSLERTRAAAALHRRTGLPILVSGGIAGDVRVAVGSLMAESLIADFDTPPRWVETQSRTTWENAQDSVAILRRAGISSVYLVTNAWHMPRALLAFRRAGLVADPAPVRQDLWPPLTWQQFVPQASVWQRSYFGLHEWIGLAYYALR